MFDKERIREKIEIFLETEGYILFDLKWIVTPKGGILRIYVDKEEGGITLQECSSLNEEISLLLDREMDIISPYTLEVSSPGIDWPIKTPKDWRRILHKRVELLFSDSRRIEGKVVSIEEDGVILELGENSRGKSYLSVGKVLFRDIVKAKQKIV